MSFPFHDLPQLLLSSSSCFNFCSSSSTFIGTCLLTARPKLPKLRFRLADLKTSLALLGDPPTDCCLAFFFVDANLPVSGDSDVDETDSKFDRSNGTLAYF